MKPLLWAWLDGTCSTLFPPPSPSPQPSLIWNPTRDSEVTCERDRAPPLGIPGFALYSVGAFSYLWGLTKCRVLESGRIRRILVLT